MARGHYRSKDKGVQIHLDLVDRLYQNGYNDAQEGHDAKNFDDAYLMGYADGKGDLERLSRFKNNPNLREEWAHTPHHLKTWMTEEEKIWYGEEPKQIRAVDRLFRRKPRA